MQNVTKLKKKQKQNNNKLDRVGEKNFTGRGRLDEEVIIYTCNLHK